MFSLARFLPSVRSDASAKIEPKVGISERSHPDYGGTPEQFQSLQSSYNDVLLRYNFDSVLPRLDARQAPKTQGKTPGQPCGNGWISAGFKCDPEKAKAASARLRNPENSAVKSRFVDRMRKAKGLGAGPRDKQLSDRVAKKIAEKAKEAIAPTSKSPEPKARHRTMAKSITSVDGLTSRMKAFENMAKSPSLNEKGRENANQIVQAFKEEIATREIKPLKLVRGAIATQSAIKTKNPKTAQKAAELLREGAGLPKTPQRQGKIKASAATPESMIDTSKKESFGKKLKRKAREASGRVIAAIEGRAAHGDIEALTKASDIANDKSDRFRRATEKVESSRFENVQNFNAKARSRAAVMTAKNARKKAKKSSAKSYANYTKASEKVSSHRQTVNAIGPVRNALTVVDDAFIQANLRRRIEERSKDGKISGDDLNLVFNAVSGSAKYKQKVSESLTKNGLVRSQSKPSNAESDLADQLKNAGSSMPKRRSAIEQAEKSGISAKKIAEIKTAEAMRSRAARSQKSTQRQGETIKRGGSTLWKGRNGQHYSIDSSDLSDRADTKSGKPGKKCKGGWTSSDNDCADDKPGPMEKAFKKEAAKRKKAPTSAKSIDTGAKSRIAGLIKKLEQSNKTERESLPEHLRSLPTEGKPVIKGGSPQSRIKRLLSSFENLDKPLDQDFGKELKKRGKK